MSRAKRNRARRGGVTLSGGAGGLWRERYPHQLSGGQQQRVAMARAVVYRPDVLLLDEPLSNLDVKLRVAMRAELKRLQQALGITTVFVTHDQHEALALSDRIAVMRDGRMSRSARPKRSTSIRGHRSSPTSSGRQTCWMAWFTRSMATLVRSSSESATSW